ncbi:MAG: flagellar biosynthetic protein FliR [Lachnospiraceae bacterium]|nr:flagellar biosynthetic protein FliR [Lachnospiraceae bacterium]
MIDYTFSYLDLEYFLLVLVRLSAFIFAAPFFSTQGIPRQVKVSLAIFLALIVYHITPGHVMPEYHSVIGYSILVIREAITGLVIGLGANICTMIVTFAGRVADMEMGLSMVQLFDPLTNESAGFTGMIYQYAIILIMMITNMHHFFLRAIMETFTLIPVGAARFSSEDFKISITQFMGDYILIAFQICLPIVASIMILNAVLGILAKSAPQINMFSVGIQIKILVGMGIMMITIGVLPSVSEYIFKEMRVMVTAMVESMR